MTADDSSVEQTLFEDEDFSGKGFSRAELGYLEHGASHEFSQIHDVELKAQGDICMSGVNEDHNMSKVC